MKLIFILFIFCTLICFSASKSVVIECTFPCSEDSNDVCEVNTHFVKCKQRTNKTKWILKDPKSLPEYQGGPLIELGQTCQTAPYPKLKDASHLSANTSETVLEWPPISNTETYDEYYSNCEKSLFCDRANICVQQFQHGEVCESDNQCYQGICNNNTCQEDNSRKEQPHSTYNTIHIILTVVGIVLFLGLLFGAYMIRRTKLKQKKQHIEKLNDLPFKKTTTSRSNSSSSNTTNDNNNMLLLHPDYDPAFQTTTTPSSSSTISHNHSPSRQQQELQLQLQRQLQPTSSNLPPPPYSP